MKFYGLHRLTAAAISAHKNGRKFTPENCRGSVGIFYASDIPGNGFCGRTMAFGTAIQATSIPEYIFTINKLLDDGATITAEGAREIGRTLYCSYIQGVRSAQTIQVEDEVQTEVEVQLEEVPEDRQVESEDSQVDEVETETEELVEDTETESDETGDDSLDDSSESDEGGTPSSGVQVDWDYAESFIDTGSSKSEAKSNLEKYAREFGIELDKRSKFENMMIEFKSAVNGDSDGS